MDYFEKFFLDNQPVTYICFPYM